MTQLSSLFSRYSKKTRNRINRDLEAAARLLGRREWIQGAEIADQRGDTYLDMRDFNDTVKDRIKDRKDYGSSEEVPRICGFCAIGALNAVGASQKTIAAVNKVVGAVTSNPRSKFSADSFGELDPVDDIVTFNDERAERRRDVLSMFRRTQRALRNKA